jgi:hypothetical protein
MTESQLQEQKGDLRRLNGKDGEIGSTKTKSRQDAQGVK